MSRYRPQPQSGRNSQTTDDYHDHVNKMLRMPSVSDAPPYPRVHVLFRNDHGHLPETQEEKEITAQAQMQREAKEETVVEKPEEPEEETDVNKVADGYIQNKHRAFQLFKWKTFKAST